MDHLDILWHDESPKDIAKKELKKIFLEGIETACTRPICDKIAESASDHEKNEKDLVQLEKEALNICEKVNSVELMDKVELFKFILAYHRVYVIDLPMETYDDISFIYKFLPMLNKLLGFHVEPWSKGSPTAFACAYVAHVKAVEELKTFCEE
jgi:hypothetical protein